MPDKDNSRIQMTLDVLAVVFSLIAVVVSLWSNNLSTEANTLARKANDLAQEANDLTSQEYAPHVVVLSVEIATSVGIVGSEAEGRPAYEVCAYTINMVNLGGVAASIIDGVTNGYFQQAKVSLGKEFVPYVGQTPLSPMIDRMTSVAVSTQDFQAVAEPYLHNASDPEFFQNMDLDFPVRIEPKSAYDFIELVWFRLLPSYPYNLNAESPGVSPVEVDFEFRLTSGDVVKTQRVPCLYLK